MKHARICRCTARLRRVFCCLLAVVCAAVPAAAGQQPSTTTVSDVIYRADGTPAGGTLVVSWPAFTTAEGKTVAAGNLGVSIGEGGAVSLALAPNEGAAPAGTYYRVVLRLDDGTTHTEYWSVPAASPVTIAEVRSAVAPATVAANFVRKIGDETIQGVKTFLASPLVPEPSLPAAAASKAYVDAVAGGGGGPLGAVISLPPDGSSQTIYGALQVFGQVPTDPALLILGALNQSADLLRVMDSGGATHLRVEAGGQVAARNLNSTRNAGQFLSLQEAIDDTAGSGPIVIPCGTHDLAAPLELPKWADYLSHEGAVVLRGAAHKCATLRATADNIVLVNGRMQFRLHDVTLDANGRSGVTGVYLAGVQKAELHNVDFIGGFARALVLEGNAGGSTAGNMSSGSALLAVTGGSPPEFTINQRVTVAGAGAGGSDLVARVTAISGSSITLSEPASTTVSGADVTLHTVGTFYNKLVNPVFSDAPEYGIHAQTKNFTLGNEVWVAANDIYGIRLSTAAGQAVHVRGAHLDFHGGSIENNAWGVWNEAGRVRFFGTWEEKNNNFASPGGHFFDPTYSLPGSVFFGTGWENVLSPVQTTGSISNGSNVLTVADANRIVAGKTIRVAGAGSASPGSSLESRVVSVSGTTVTLADNAMATVSNTAVTGPVISLAGENQPASSFAIGHTGVYGAGAINLQRFRLGRGQPSPAFYNRIYGGYELNAAPGDTVFYNQAAGGLTEWRVQTAGGGANLARFDFANNVVRFQGSNGIQVGSSGALLKSHLSATAGLDFGSVVANSCSDLSMTVSGAAPGDTVALGLLDALASTAGLSFSAWVSAADTVTVRACNAAVTNSADPASATVRVSVWKY
jgi:hypothetical protein